MSAVRGPEGIIHIDFSQRSKRTGKRFIIGLFPLLPCGSEGFRGGRSPPLRAAAAFSASGPMQSPVVATGLPTILGKPHCYALQAHRFNDLAAPACRSASR